MSQALVSVGIPTYNRPEGLRRTLEQITAQTYQNLEIIISDNASPNDLTEQVSQEFASKDSRIQYFRQEENKGGSENFRFVLEKSRGEFFMWAADDDEWDAEFIEKCVSAIGQFSSAMSSYSRIYRETNTEEKQALPDIDPSYSVYKNMQNYFLRMTAHLVYGLHRRKDIEWVLQLKFFDWWDCYFVSSLLLRGKGIVLINDYHGYKAGTPVGSNFYKPFHPEKGLQYWPFFKEHVSLLFGNKALNIKQKISLIDKIFLRTLWFYCQHNKDKKPRRVSLINTLLVCKYKFLGLINAISPSIFKTKALLKK